MAAEYIRVCGFLIRKNSSTVLYKKFTYYSQVMSRCTAEVGKELDTRKRQEAKFTMYIYYVVKQSVEHLLPKVKGFHIFSF